MTEISLCNGGTAVLSSEKAHLVSESHERSSSLRRCSADDGSMCDGAIRDRIEDNIVYLPWITFSYVLKSCLFKALLCRMDRMEGARRGI